MKRFKFDKVSLHHRKLNQRIRFPISSSSSLSSSSSSSVNVDEVPYLDMAPYMTASKMKSYEMLHAGLYAAKKHGDNDDDNDNDNDNDTLCTSYDLYAIVHHSGALGSGHYVTTAKDSDSRDGEWFLYNDDEVSKIKE